MRQQYKISFSADLREKLDQAAQANGRPVSDEIRSRLERSFAREALDPKTRELMGDIAGLAQWIEDDTRVAWHDLPAAHAAFSEAVRAWLDTLTPEPKPGAVMELFSPSDPVTLGRTIARAWSRVKAMGAKLSQSTEDV